MTRATRTLTAGFILGWSLVGAAPASAETLKATTLMVLVQDDASVPANTLESGKEKARRVFQHMDVEIIWLEHGDARLEDPAVLRSLVVVHLVAREMTDRTKTADSVFGMASPGTHLVIVFYNRIENLSRTGDHKDTACILGHVVAHEIGHLLLGPHAHSLAGIMQAVLNTELAGRGWLFFTASQAQLIRAKLAAS
jgi:hypothetical protein